MHMPNMYISIIMLLLTVVWRICLVFSFLNVWLHYSPASLACQERKRRIVESYKKDRKNNPGV